MELTMLKAKIHRATVTQAELDYVGSITIDRALLEESGIQNAARYRARNLPAAGASLRDEDLEQKQISLDL